MSLKAQVRTDSMGNITVHMEGGLDFENNEPIRNELIQLSKDNPQSIITIDMFRVDFVGSSGIGHFVDTLRILNQRKSEIKLSNVKTEFLRVFKLFQFDAYSLLVDQFENDKTEDLSQKFAARRRTFEN